MKKVTSILLSLVMLISIMGGLNLTANAEGFYSYYCGDFEYTYWNDGVKILSYRGDDTEIVVPKTINNLPVLNIGMQSGNYENITSLKMPDTVICISYYGLSGFESLKNITFSKNLQTIERLSCCYSGFTSLLIPDSVKTIGENAFLCCESLESITISKNIESIDKKAFNFCPALKDIYFTDTKAEWEKLGVTVSGATVHYGQTDPNITNNDNDYPNEPDPSENNNNNNNNNNNINDNINDETDNSDVDTEEESDTYSNSEDGEETEKENEDSKGDEDSKEEDCSSNQESNVPNSEENEYSSFQQTDKRTADTQTAKKNNVNNTVVINTIVTTIKKVKRNKNSITVKWNKVKYVSGYQLQFATNKKFTKNIKTVNVNNAKVSKKTVKKLKRNKKYYVRIRTYKTVNNNKYYSNWSKSKTVKVK